MSSATIDRLKSIFVRSDAVQSVESGSDMIFEITERPRPESIECGIDAVGQQTRFLIRSRNTYMESYLNFHYNFGVSPFQLHKNGQIDSPNGKKVRNA